MRDWLAAFLGCFLLLTFFVTIFLIATKAPCELWTYSPEVPGRCYDHFANR